MLDGFRLSQVVIVPILKKNTDTAAVLKAADDLATAASSAGIRAKVDAGTEKTPGFKFSFWEMKVRNRAQSLTEDKACKTPMPFGNHNLKSH